MVKNGSSKTIFPKKTGINLEWPKMAVLIFPTIFPKETGINLKWPKMAIPNFSNNFSQKDWYKFGMAKNGCSEFFPTIFPKRLV